MFFCKHNSSVTIFFPNSPNLFLLFCYQIPSMYIAKCNSNMNRKDYNQIQSTQANVKHNINCKRASQCISNQGSVTVEAALVLPFFFFVLYAILLISQFLMTEDRIHSALVETGRVLAGEEAEHITLARAKLELNKRLKSNSLDLVSGGVAGISLSSSQLPNSRHEIELYARYRMKVSIPFLFTFSIPVQVTVTQRMFDGCHITDASEGGKGEYVYIAEHESVYHTDSQCSYLAIRLVPVTEVSSLKGNRQCETCKHYQQTGEYVTLTGDCIHHNPDCGRIHRTIHLVERDNIGNLPLCSRCAKKADR